MFTAHITMTGKSYHPKSEWTNFADDQVKAPTLKALKTKLAERYGPSWNHKRPMYRDKVNGPTVRAGWIVGFRAEDCSHSPVNRWIQQDWISISECTPVEWKAS